MGDPLQTLLDPKGNDGEARDHDEPHVERHGARICQHSAEHTLHGSGVQPLEFSGGCADEVLQHPAGHGGVEHHQQHISCQAEVAVDVPFGAGLQLLVQMDGTFLGSPAHGKLHGQHGNADEKQAQQVDQHKSAAAILTVIQEISDVADADGAIRR